MDSRLYWIWLQQALGYGSQLAAPALHRFIEPQALYEADRRTLEEAGFGRVRKLQDKSLEAARAVLTRVRECGDWLLTPADAAYPELLRGIYAPPLVLYGRGVVPDTDRQPVIAVVGTREITQSGYDITFRLSAGLTAGGALIVSGCARGADTAALTGSLQAGGRPLSVQACGLDVEYPLENASLRRAILASGGTLLTEYAYGVRPYRGCFSARNRLMSGLSHGVCVTEAPAKSGALITATWAREQGRDVFAIPGAITAPNSQGSNTLIQKGAYLVRNACEVLREYDMLFPDILDLSAAEKAFDRPDASVGEFSDARAQAGRKPQAQAQKPACPAGASETARRVFAELNEQPRLVDEVAAALSLSIPETMAALTELEMLGGAHGHAGQQYSL